jgi:hypothetical protein
MNHTEQFKYHSFVSLSEVKTEKGKEWRGETKNDEIVIIKYQDGKLSIGAGWSEDSAKNNVLDMAESIGGKGRMEDKNLRLEKVNEDLGLCWELPVGYIEG